MKLSMVAAAILAISCGTTTTPGGNPGQTPTCSLTVTGGPAAGTYNCEPATTVWASSNNTGGFGFTVSAADLTVAIGWTGEPTGGMHVTTSSAGVQGGVSLTSGSGASTQVWGADIQNGGGVQGSFDLYFSGISANFSTTNGKAYTADGTLSATLVPLTGQSGNVTVSVTF